LHKNILFVLCYFLQIIPHRITLCITVFGVLGSWGGNGLELRAPVKIKMVRPAQAAHPIQKSTGQGKPKKNATFGAI
jgi:hypothetical protein